MKKVFKIDPFILICSLVLTGIGIFTLYSLTINSAESKTDFFQTEFRNQLIFALVGLILSTIVFIIPIVYFRFKLIIAILFSITFLLLAYTALFAPEVKGVRRWIMVGSQITIQPSEIAKVIMIIIASALFSIPVYLNEENRAKFGNIKEFFHTNKYAILAFIACSSLIGLVIAQPSLSVATILSLIFLMIYFSKVKYKSHIFVAFLSFFIAMIASQNLFYDIPLGVRALMFIVAIGLYVLSIFHEKLSEILIFSAVIVGVIIGSVIIPMVWNHVLHDFQRERIEAYINPNRDEQDEGFQQEQAKISIGAGQFFGNGFRQISKQRLKELPESTTDFVFAVFAFKFGFIGSLIIILLYMLLILRIFYLADKMNDQFSSLVLIGIGTMILVQFCSNMGMNLDILPVGGTTLPFMSAGGSSLLSMMIAIALAENVIATNRQERNVYKNKENVLINGWNM